MEVFEFFGVIIVNDYYVYDIEKVFRYMKCGMEERYVDLLCLLFKKKMELVEVY